MKIFIGYSKGSYEEVTINFSHFTEESSAKAFLTIFYENTRVIAKRDLELVTFDSNCCAILLENAVETSLFNRYITLSTSGTPSIENWRGDKHRFKALVTNVESNEADTLAKPQTLYLVTKHSIRLAPNKDGAVEFISLSELSLMTAFLSNILMAP